MSRRQVYILEAVGLFSGSIGVWLHHIPYIPFTAGLVAAIASQSPDVMSVLSVYRKFALRVFLQSKIIRRIMGRLGK